MDIIYTDNRSKFYKFDSPSYVPRVGDVISLKGFDPIFTPYQVLEVNYLLEVTPPNLQRIVVIIDRLESTSPSTVQNYSDLRPDTP